MNDEVKSEEFASHALFNTDDAGQLTHLRGTAIPQGTIHTAISASSAELPAIDNDWVLKGAYAFARQLRQRSPGTA